MGSSGLHLVHGDGNELVITQGTDLQDWENASRNNDYETGVLVNKDGVPVKAWSDKARHSVGIPDSILQNPAYEGATFTHNHPDSGWGGTFSTADFRTFAKSNWGEMRATTKQGETYILKATKNADRKALSNYLRSQGKFLQKNFDRSYTKALKEASAKPYKTGAHKGMIKLTQNGKTTYTRPMNPTQADAYARQVAVGMYTRTYKKNLAKFGFTYTVKKANTNANSINKKTGYSSK